MKVKSKISDDTDTKEEKKPFKIEVFVRAFKDAGEKDWNQESKTVTVKLSGFDGDGDSDDDGDGGGFLPGFESLIMVTAFIILLFIISKHKRR